MQRHEKDLPLQTYLSAYSAIGKQEELLGHIRLYRFVAGLLKPGATVTDVGCGEGFGVFCLAKTAAGAVGIEHCPRVVEHARRMYSHSGARYLCLDVFAGVQNVERADVVCALDVIEHVNDGRAFLAKLREIAKPGGTIAVSTPNKLLSLLISGRPYPFHAREYCHSEFSDLLQSVFGSSFQMFAVNPGALSRVTLARILKARALQRLPHKLRDLLRLVRFKMSAPRTRDAWIARLDSAWADSHNLHITPVQPGTPPEEASDYLAVAKV